MSEKNTDRMSEYVDDTVEASKKITSFDEMISSLNAGGMEIEILIPAADSKSALAGTGAFMESLDIPVRAVLAGPATKIEAVLREMENKGKLRPENVTLLPAESPEEIFDAVLNRIDRRKNQIILKGNITSDQLMRGLLQKKEKIIDKGKIITHLRLFETDDGMTVMSDGGINVVSNITDREKRDKLLAKIRINALRVGNIFGIDQDALFIPDAASGIDELKGTAVKLFTDPRVFPKIIQFPWIGPANILYKSAAYTPWSVRYEKELELSCPGTATVFTRLDTGTPLVVAGPEKGAGPEEKTVLLEKVLEKVSALGVDTPKTALLDFTEQYESFTNTPSIRDSRKLVKKFDGKEIGGRSCVVEGPMAYDLAVSEKAAKVKKFDSRVSGSPDILFTPDFTSAVLLTALYADWKPLRLPWPAADISFGSTVPIVVPSRSDPPDHKLRSITAAVYISAHTG